MEGRAEVPVSDGNACVGRYRQRRRDPRYHLKGDPGLGQELQLFAAPAKEEGVAALEAHHPLARLGFLQENLVDLVLGHLVVAGLLAHVDLLGTLGHQGEDGGAHQPVVDHHLGLGNGLFPLFREQSRVAGTRAHQNDLTVHCPRLLGKAPAPGLRPALGRLALRRCGCPGG